MNELRATLGVIQNPWAPSDVVIATFRCPTRVREYFQCYDEDDDYDNDDKRNSCLDEFERSCNVLRSIKTTK